ncbi:hypothetical protein Bca52824_016232 [Brassica carinata]|uniref:Sugar phosphate transporter domain-containing protein n=1 Tax=Brassica carinata TaxID=52824 RepID=A0A8X8B3W6_BRACI|nr:hypothetical protein Bca52824_016232 [Brassica carinata]
MESPEKKTLAILTEEPKRATFSSSDMSFKGVFAAVSYMASAVLLVIFNKAALSSYSFPSANVITLLQMLSSCFILYVMKKIKIIAFCTDKSKNEHKSLLSLVSRRRLVQTIPLAFTYLLYMLVTMESVRNINVPMYTTLRRTTILFTMIMEYFLSGQKHSASIISSVGIILLGAIIAGIRDLSFDAYGYGLVFTANLCTATYLALIARTGKSSGLNTFGLMWCNGKKIYFRTK